MQPGPKRTSDSWANFLERHTETLWACDLFGVKAVISRGLQELYVLVFLCVHSREVIVSTSTEHPNSAWVVKQTKAFLDQTANCELKPAILMHDRDTKFTKEFTQTAREQGVQTNPLPKASPNLNGCCEKFIGTIKRKALSKFILFGR